MSQLTYATVKLAVPDGSLEKMNDSAVIAALVGGAAVLLASIIGLISTIVGRRQTTRNSREIEQLKRDLAQKGQILEFHNHEVKASLESLRVGIETIQRFKDEIRLILDATGDSLLLSEAKDRMTIARDQMLAEYAKNESLLSSRERRFHHQAKNDAIYGCEVIARELPKYRFVGELDAGVNETLRNIRERLTEAQNFLRDSRTEKLIEHAGGRAS